MRGSPVHCELPRPFGILLAGRAIYYIGGLVYAEHTHELAWDGTACGATLALRTTAVASKMTDGQKTTVQNDRNRNETKKKRFSIRTLQYNT